MLGPVTAEEMQAARILTGTTMAAWLACGLLPGTRLHAAKIRAFLLTAYLLGCAAYIAYVVFR